MAKGDKVEFEFDPFELVGLDDVKERLTKRATSEALSEIADLVLEEVLAIVSSGRSPVTGRQFKGLSPAYKAFKDEFGATPEANLELTGDMLDGLRVKKRGDKIHVTVTESEQGKADNHNKFSAASKKTGVPARKFIPNSSDDETYKAQEIKSGIKKIIGDFLADAED